MVRHRPGVAQDEQFCAKLLQDDLSTLCHSSASTLGDAADMALRKSDGGSGFLYASEPGAAQASLPPQCSASRSKRPLYTRDLVHKPMASIGDMQVVPGVNRWGVVMANSTLNINGKVLTFDDIIYGYDLMFENLALFSHTSWFGVSIQQDPSDAFQLASLLWHEQPDLLIEIGTNTGGGAIFYATVMREYNSNALVLTIDPKDPAQDWASAVGQGCAECNDVRCTRIWHSKNVKFIHGFSSEAKVLKQVEEIVPRFNKIMVMHDGSHFFQHVLEDLRNYDRFTSVGSYMVVQDTKMSRMYTPLNGNPYPLGAAEEFMRGQGKDRYAVDKQFEYLVYSQHHNGWLRKLKA
eukprot:CAMPEP_0117621546 /NCGR_PEP_ID=MMETSP0784-20121206/87688_1 /TAXON_ID=39447 /ORGANISM="" /LENGTH=349 /DNA_ID=CAMNT_0005425471 /DNA_START=106 /DNA_END=1155 /DNA_ORIENTATION=+